MLEQNRRYKNIGSGLLDGVLLYAAYLLCYLLRFTALPYFEPGGAGPALEYARSAANYLSGAGLALAAVLGFWLAGVYDSSRLRGRAS